MTFQRAFLGLVLIYLGFSLAQIVVDFRMGLAPVRRFPTIWKPLDEHPLTFERSSSPKAFWSITLIKIAVTFMLIVAFVSLLISS